MWWNIFILSIVNQRISIWNQCCICIYSWKRCSICPRGHGCIWYVLRVYIINKAVAYRLALSDPVVGTSCSDSASSLYSIHISWLAARICPPRHNYIRAFDKIILCIFMQWPYINSHSMFIYKYAFSSTFIKDKYALMKFKTIHQIK